MQKRVLYQTAILREQFQEKSNIAEELSDRFRKVLMYQTAIIQQKFQQHWHLLRELAESLDMQTQHQHFQVTLKTVTIPE